MNFQAIARALDPSLYDAIQPYRVTRDEDMPEEYRAGHRPLHDDWAVFKDVRRTDCAYRVPLPFKVISGKFHRDWMTFDPAYPVSPGMETRTVDGDFQVLTDRGEYGIVKYAAFINGEWRHVFTKYTGIWFGKRLSWYKGLHQDNHVTPAFATGTGRIRSDLMCWFPELACSWVKEI